MLKMGQMAHFWEQNQNLKFSLNLFIRFFRICTRLQVLIDW